MDAGDRCIGEYIVVRTDAVSVRKDVLRMHSYRGICRHLAVSIFVNTILHCSLGNFPLAFQGLSSFARSLGSAAFIPVNFDHTEYPSFPVELVQII